MITDKLHQIQQQLNVPKSEYNAFGKYHYRSCEGILNALKPLLKAMKTTVTLSDEVVAVGGRIYVKATATLTDVETSETCTVTAYAREEDKKGMDGSQITGASSSYARKYALNGMFAIDDTKDSDTTNAGQKKPVQAAKKTEQTAPTDYQIKTTRLFLMQNEKARVYYLNQAQAECIDDLNLEEVYKHLKSNNKINF